MVIIGFSDIHGDISELGNIAAAVAAADVVLLTGDITHFGRRQASQQVLRSIRDVNDNVLAVTGNCDYDDVETHLADEAVDLHRRCRRVAGIAFIGLSGSLPAPGRTPNVSTEEQLQQSLRQAAVDLGGDEPTVLVAHQPPARTVNDRISSGQHVGSLSVRAFIDERQPLVCLTGHIHEGVGVDTIGDTTIVNPGPLRDGGYAYVSIENKAATVEIRGR